MKQKEKIGAFFKVPIDEKNHIYGRIIENYRYAFYDFKTDAEISDLNNIEKSDILFILIVHKNAINKGIWEIIGQKELPAILKRPVRFFIQDIVDFEKCWIDLNGNREQATLKECMGIERLAVWDAIHVEQRLKDYYDGVPNKYSYGLRLNGLR